MFKFGDFSSFPIALSIVIFLLSVAAVVLAFIFIVPEKRKAKLNKFGKFLHDLVNFKYLIVEKILQAFYIFATAYVFLTGFFMLFVVTKSYDYYGYSAGGNWLGGYGILVMIFGPIFVRLIYEVFMMLILLVKNTIAINNKLKNQNDEPVAGDPFATPDLSEFKPAYQQQAPDYQQQAPNYQQAPVYQPQGYAQPQQPVVPQNTVPVNNAVLCPNCGAVVEEGDFCPGCGTRVR